VAAVLQDFVLNLDLGVQGRGLRRFSFYLGGASWRKGRGGAAVATIAGTSSSMIEDGSPTSMGARQRTEAADRATQLRC